MIQALEKLFIFGLVISGLFLLSLFGLYFDVGQLFVMITGEEAKVGADDSRKLIEMMEGQRPKRVSPGDLSGNQSGGADAELTQAQEDYYFKRLTISVEDVKHLKENQLKSNGFKNPVFLKMETLGCEREKYSTTMKLIERAGDASEMISILLEAIKNENPEN